LFVVAGFSVSVTDRPACKILFILMKHLVRCLLVVIATSLALTACNVTRTVTTSSEYFQRGDTTVVIQTRTVESYDGTKK
jgi:hypothetical protein